MTAFAYDTDRLRSGARGTRLAADAAERAGARLAGTCGASPFGTVVGADALHAAVGTARDRHVATVRAGAQALRRSAAGAAGAARLGDDATVATAAAAARGV